MNPTTVGECPKLLQILIDLAVTEFERCTEDQVEPAIFIYTPSRINVHGRDEWCVDTVGPLVNNHKHLIKQRMVNFVKLIPDLQAIAFVHEVIGITAHVSGPEEAKRITAEARAVGLKNHPLRKESLSICYETREEIIQCHAEIQPAINGRRTLGPWQFIRMTYAEWREGLARMDMDAMQIRFCGTFDKAARMGG